MAIRWALSGCATALILASCASPSQMLINQQNSVIHCSASGWGYIGAPLAHHEFSKCVDAYEAIGYLPMEDAGLVGILFSPTTFTIVSVTPNSPAAAVGMGAGDKMVQINGVTLSDAATTQKLLFGKAETPVTITIQRNGQTIPYTVLRAHRAQ